MPVSPRAGATPLTHPVADPIPSPLAGRSLSVFVPAFNEVENLRPTVETIVRVLSVSVEEYELIIVNDGSTDGTDRLAESIAQQYPEVRVIHNPRNMGLGYGFSRAIEAATKSSFVFVPGDNCWPYRSLLELFGNLGKADVVTSYTTNPEIRTPGRRVISQTYTRGLNLLFGLNMRYYNGLTIFPTSFLKAHPIQTAGFGSMAETLLRAIHEGLSMIEVACPVEERVTGRSNALTPRNLKSVAGTVGRLFVDLRLRSARSDHSTLGLLPARGSRRESHAHAGGERRNGVAKALSSSTADDAEPAQRRRIVLTGASSGIGAELVRALAADGHQVFACARRKELLDAVTQHDTLAKGYRCDVSDEAEVRAFVEWVQDQTPAVDVVFNCAGGFGAIGAIDQTDSAEWFDTIRVNVFGTYLVTKHLLPLLAGSSDPRIINFSGGGAFNPFPNYSAYACSKAAIVRMTECLAAELAPRGITVNALAPGFIWTEAHQKTLEAGAEKAGAMQYQRTKVVAAEGGAPMASVIDLARTLMSPRSRGLTGKTISANFDPWRTEGFFERLAEIARSDLWTMRRVGIVNLPEGSLRGVLTEAWAHVGTRS